MAKKITEELEKAEYIVKRITQKEEKRWPFPPFNTSSLQQEASTRLKFSSKKTMKLAQDLYEQGLITYMRTDSVNLSWLAINTARELIEKEFGKSYLPEKTILYKTKAKLAQEAHEAIRPTYIENNREKIGSKDLFEDHLALYDLIWKRMVACQMKPALISVNIVSILARNYLFESRGTVVSFPGYSKVWPVKIAEKTLPDLTPDDKLELIDLIKEKHATEPPRRYSEASLVKTLEEKGIGRPSTYAPIISTIQDRGYVVLQNHVFYSEEIGKVVTDLLKEHFSDIVDINFTAKMEENFDDIAEGKKSWEKVIQDFYGPFEKNLDIKYKVVDKGKIINEESKEICPKCGKPMVIKLGKYGKFLACSGFPECKTTHEIINKIGVSCLGCKSGEVIERRTKKGKVFWGCSNYPKCRWASWNRPSK